MKKRINNLDNGIWLVILALFSLLSLPSCTEELVAPEDPGMELPSKFYDEWKNENGEVAFTISSRSIKKDASVHRYDPKNVSETNGIYLVDLPEIQFRISEGSNANEISIGTSTTLATYYKEVEIVNPPAEPVNLPDEFNGHWYKEDGYTSSSYFIAEDYIKTSSILFNYTENDVTSNNQVYTVVGTADDGTAYTFKIEQYGDGHKLKIEKNDEGVKMYWDSPAVELPSSVFTVWYNYDGSLSYIIDPNQGNPYINTENTRYSFGPRNVEFMENEIYHVLGESSSNTEKSFFLKKISESELSISEDTSTNDNYISYWNNKDNIPNIGDFFFRKWFEVGANTMTYRMYVNSNGIHVIRDLSDGTVQDYVFHPTKGDVKKLGTDRFEIDTKGTDGRTKTFYIKKNGTDDNSINMAADSESSYITFFHVTGKNIERAEHATGLFKVISGKTWGEYNDKGELLWEVREIGRSNWEVRLEKWSGGDQIVISMHQKWIFYVPKGTTQKQSLYELTGYDIEP